MYTKLELSPNQETDFEEKGVEFKLLNKSNKKRKIKIEIK